MSITTKIATTASAIALAVGSLAAAAAPASAASHTHCTTKHGHNYPGGKCYVDTNKSTYHKKHAHVHFKSGKDFSKHARVKVHLVCGSHHASKTVHANSHGSVLGQISVPKSVKRGSCTITLRGSGSVVHGHFKVHTHHHHHKKH